MTLQDPSWETLNAYVDGELPAGAAAEVARALARDPALARQVASLTRLKAATQEAAQEVGAAGAIALPAPRNRRWRAPALAASLTLVLAIGLTAVLVPIRDQGPPSWVIQARAQHDAWTAPQDLAPPAVGGVVLVALGEAGAGDYLKAYIPNLTSARLTLTHLESVTLANGGAALHAGYRGTRGCKVSLLVLPGGEDLPRELTRRDDAALRAFAWQAGPLGYILLAEGMDEVRLELIAETVHRATIENSPFDGETRTALKQSRERSQPCQA